MIRGIKVKIPSNATVDTTATHLERITYSGVWDTFATTTWTNDPAWVMGFAHQRKIRSWSSRVVIRSLFFAISQYCNALVDDGKGGQEHVLVAIY